MLWGPFVSFQVIEAESEEEIILKSRLIKRNHAPCGVRSFLEFFGKGLILSCPSMRFEDAELVIISAGFSADRMCFSFIVPTFS